MLSGKLEHLGQRNPHRKTLCFVEYNLALKKKKNQKSVVWTFSPLIIFVLYFPLNILYIWLCRVCTVYCDHIQHSLPSFSSPYTATHSSNLVPLLPSLLSFPCLYPPPLYFPTSSIFSSPSISSLLLFPPSISLVFFSVFNSCPVQLLLLCFSVYNADVIRRRWHPVKLSIIPRCQQSVHPSFVMFLEAPNGWHRYCV